MTIQQLTDLICFLTLAKADKVFGKKNKEVIDTLFNAAQSEINGLSDENKKKRSTKIEKFKDYFIPLVQLIEAYFKYKSP